MTWLMLAHALPAQVPALLGVQGRVVVSGVPFEGVGVFKFALLDGASSSVLWSSSSDGNGDGEPDAGVSLNVTRGIYSVLLGDTAVPVMAPLPLSAFTHGDLRLRVWFNDGSHGFQALAPDQRLAASAYAMMAANVPNGAIGTAQLAPGTLNASNISGAFVPAQLPADVAYRSTDLASVTNDLLARLASLSNVVSQLKAQIAAGAASGTTNLPAGAALLGTDPNDASLISLGFARALSHPAPPWLDGPATGEPVARSAHAAVWTGREMLVWGGTVGSGRYLGTGGRFDPVENAWRPMLNVLAPAARAGHSAVWTGTELVVWGGVEAGGLVRTGGRYSPDPEQWRTTALTDAPTARDRHCAVWTGGRMAIWGGQNAGGLLGDGALYDPVGNVWSSLPGANAPTARRHATAAWTGTHLLVWGGETGAGPLGDGGRIALGAGGASPGSWQPLNSVGAPSPRSGHAAVWTGAVWIVWGGKGADGTPLGDGAIYRPDTDAWEPLGAAGAPTARFASGAAWTGSEMLVFGGENAGGVLASGAAYSPAAGTWRALSNLGDPVARAEAGVVWTGTRFLVFGGRSGSTRYAALRWLDPQPAWHLYRKL